MSLWRKIQKNSYLNVEDDDTMRSMWVKIGFEWMTTELNS